MAGNQIRLILCVFSTWLGTVVRQPTDTDWGVIDVYSVCKMLGVCVGRVLCLQDAGWTCALSVQSALCTQYT
eukprot:167830-Hanusia_phi.AAC.1